MKGWTMSNIPLSRRRFIKAGAAAAAIAPAAQFALCADQPAAPAADAPRPTDPGPAQKVFPRWRGFNLVNFFTQNSDANPQEDDFRWIRDWGFDFVRLPMSYRLWIEGDDWDRIREDMLARIDKVVDFGQKYAVHVSLNLHRAPGYCVNPPAEPKSLWKDEAAEQVFCRHWAMFAGRYKGVPSKFLSFDLVNEPRKPDDSMTAADYIRVVRSATAAIRAADPQRLVIIDGLGWGRDPVPELIDLGLGQSCRGYDPMEISHYKASWVNGERFPEPIWPDPDGKTHKWDRKRLEEHYKPWADLAKKGVGVHCGECGCFNKTPHPVFLAWFRDVLDILKSHNIGWALWNLRGSFGVINSQRSDVQYEDFNGQKLDKALLTLLQQS